ncbi:MAG: hypothetical protein ACRD1S_12860 [Vicinamibacterales bacterium]
MVGRDAVALDAAMDELAAAGCEAHAIIADVTAAVAPSRIVGAAVQAFGGIDALEEIAELIYFLSSDKSGWITGETISIDGGRHLTCLR